MTESNYRSAAGFGVRQTTHRLSMSAYDWLPEPLRQALRDAPYDMSAEYVLDLWQDKGLAAALAEIRESSSEFLGQRA